jgi:deoxyribose-phosphate aldolase
VSHPTGQQQELRGAIEATRLGFALTAGAVESLARSAHRLAVRGVCVPIPFVATVRAVLRDLPPAPIDVVTVANFPLGNGMLECVFAEVETAVALGADHVDLVVPGGLVADRRWREAARFVEEVRLRIEEAASGSARSVVLKVILETAAFDRDRIEGAAMAALEGGARWLKTSTGFHPAGGATEDAVRLLRRLAPIGIGVKASGAIRTREDALAMIEAGADRIGTSSETTILAAAAEM